jgi:Ran GTPase-activating protein (RanGAP) involved in mRNA processing and transport
MIYHEFFSMKRDSIPNNIYMGRGILSNVNAVKLSDNIVLDSWAFQHQVVAYWPHIDDVREGLNYNGVSLIKSEDIPAFMLALEKYIRRKGVLELISLCKNAMNGGEDIVHYGI